MAYSGFANITQRRRGGVTPARTAQGGVGAGQAQQTAQSQQASASAQRQNAAAASQAAPRQRTAGTGQPGGGFKSISTRRR